jgi:hypothetical protein
MTVSLTASHLYSEDDFMLRSFRSSMIRRALSSDHRITGSPDHPITRSPDFFSLHCQYQLRCMC